MLLLLLTPDSSVCFSGVKVNIRLQQPHNVSSEREISA